MIRRTIHCLVALAALALVAAGCGSDSTGSSLGDALAYVPKDAPAVVAIDTDPEGGQWQQVDKLIAKFPFGGQVKQGFKNGLRSSSSGVDYDRDLKPLLGNDLVVAVTSASALDSGENTPFVAAWKVNDEDAGKRLVERGSSKVGTVDGADLYQAQSGTVTAIKDGTLLAARTQGDLKAALDRAGGDDHMTEDDFTAALDGLDEDALVRVTGNIAPLLAGANPAARNVKWVAALRTFGATLSAEDDGIALAFRASTEGDLGDDDLPLASGADPAPVVKRQGEIGFGLRDPAHVVTFGEEVARATDAPGYAKYQRNKKRTGRQLGIDIDRDVIAQLTGNAAVSVAVDGSFAFRSDLSDPAAAEKALAKAAPRLKRVAKDKSIGISTPKNGKGLYAVAQANGKKLAFGVIGETFVLATDAARAAQFGAASPAAAPGAKGSLVLDSDARALGNAIVDRQGGSAAAQLFTGALGDLVGSVETEPDGLTANLKLQIK